MTLFRCDVPEESIFHYSLVSIKSDTLTAKKLLKLHKTQINLVAYDQ